MFHSILNADEISNWFSCSDKECYRAKCRRHWSVILQHNICCGCICIFVLSCQYHSSVDTFLNVESFSIFEMITIILLLHVHLPIRTKLIDWRFGRSKFMELLAKGTFRGVLFKLTWRSLTTSSFCVIGNFIGHAMIHRPNMSVQSNKWK